MLPRSTATSRREFMLRAVAVASLLNEQKTRGADATPLALKEPHFAAKAKSVIFLFMEGGPSHIDLFDPKPALAKHNGKPLPDSFGKVLTAMGTGGNNLF